jgi:hypothetical protein
MGNEKTKSLGNAIDDLIEALKDLDENSRIVAIKAVLEHLKIPLFTNSAPNVDNVKYDTTANPATNSIEPVKPKLIDILTLKEAKNPSTASEMACIVAYYLQHNAPEGEKRGDITKDDIEKYFIQAKFPLPKVPLQVLVDTKNAGYLDSAGRGKYKLNPVGHNLVAHKLPREKSN